MEKPLFIQKKTGVRTDATSVMVFDSVGRIFYMKNNESGVFFTFNLPAGSYSMDVGNASFNLVAPVRFSLKKLPRPTRHKNRPPKSVRFVWIDNANKCSINLTDGVVMADKSLRKLPIFCKVFIFFHEVGHYYYKSEQECDNFAGNQMLKRGYNPSQILYAAEHTLNSPDRKAVCLGRMKKTKQK